MDDDLESIKKKLRDYQRSEIEFNEPHFTLSLAMREGSRKNVIDNIINPEKLVYAYKDTGNEGDEVWCLYFEISRSRTMKIPVIFDRKGRKSLYILTYILRYRPWQRMVKK
jgi:hypothetical protein